jgi:DNA segregation ATPase FtsK/SpoIIIE, S-DNA-T family
MTRSLLAGGARVILVTPCPSPLRSLASASGVVASFSDGSLGEEEFAAAVGSLTGPGVVVIDDAEVLIGCDASGELSRIVARGRRRVGGAGVAGAGVAGAGVAGAGVGLVCAGDADGLAGGFGGWHVDARRARRGCLTAPATLPEGELIGVRLAHAQIGHAVRPGKALLHLGDGGLITVTVPEA